MANKIHEGQNPSLRANEEPALSAVTTLGPGMYIHVPFCARSCDFCAFYQTRPDRTAIQQYLSTLEREILLLPDSFQPRTIFVGGGTPGLLSAKDLSSLGKIIHRRFSLQDPEWTIELAPGSVRPDKLTVLRDMGVNRISLGVQSFQDKMLSALGRPHPVKAVLQAYDAIRGADFGNVNLDLIFAAPGQELQEWESDLQRAISLGPEHISTYCLTFEEDTALYVKLSQGKVRRDIERERDFYLTAWNVLGTAGYLQYEISNFAKPGFASAHNLNTWAMGQWVGLGPSAASQWGGHRGQNPADLAKWESAISEGKRAQCETQVLTHSLLLEDTLIFGLRRAEGVSWPDLQKACSPGLTARAEILARQWEKDGLLSMENNGTWKLTLEGRLLADSIGAELVGTFTGPDNRN